MRCALCPCAPSVSECASFPLFCSPSVAIAYSGRISSQVRPSPFPLSPAQNPTAHAVHARTLAVPAPRQCGQLAGMMSSTGRGGRPSACRIWAAGLQDCRTDCMRMRTKEKRNKNEKKDAVMNESEGKRTHISFLVVLFYFCFHLIFVDTLWTD